MRAPLLAALLLAGCGGQVVKPLDIGGSKADATVIVGGTLESELDTMDWGLADAIAVERCAAWGYSGAKPFTGTRRQCVDTRSSTSTYPIYTYPGVTTTTSTTTTVCLSFEVTKTYQCLDCR